MLLWWLLHDGVLIIIQFATLIPLGSLAFPAISSIKSNGVSARQQGAIQGALGTAIAHTGCVLLLALVLTCPRPSPPAVGVKTLAGGLGPLCFSELFRYFGGGSQGSSHPHRYYPEAPFALGALLMVIAVVVAAVMPAPPPAGSDDSGDDGGAEGASEDRGSVQQPLLR